MAFINIFIFTPLPAPRTDGNLWSHVGNMFYRKSSLAKTQNAKRAAKLIKNFEKNELIFEGHIHALAATKESQWLSAPTREKTRKILRVMI